MPKVATAPAEGETKADRFKRLAIVRTNKALEAIAAIGGLANKNNYEFTDEQTETIVKALEAKVVEVATKFTAPEQAASAGFTL